MTTDLVIQPSEKAKAVCLWISRGYSVLKACQTAHICEQDWWDQVRENPETEREYIRARESRSHTRFEELQATIQEIKDGKLDPHAARVIIDAAKWQMGKEKARVYGDSMTLKGDKDNPLDLGLAAALERLDNRRAQPALEKPKDVIDLSPLPLNAKDYI